MTAIALSAFGYGLAVLREYHNKTRDAVTEHYISLHPDDFGRVLDRKLIFFENTIYENTKIHLFFISLSMK